MLSVRDVAAYLGVCTHTVYSLCSSGELPHIKLNKFIRISRGDLEKYIEARRAR